MSSTSNSKSKSFIPAASDSDDNSQSNAPDDNSQSDVPEESDGDIDEADGGINSQPKMTDLNNVLVPLAINFAPDGWMQAPSSFTAGCSGDCFLVPFKSNETVKYVLLDSGHENCINSICCLSAQTDIDIEGIIISHPEADHIGGLTMVYYTNYAHPLLSKVKWIITTFDITDHVQSPEANFTPHSIHNTSSKISGFVWEQTNFSLLIMSNRLQCYTVDLPNNNDLTTDIKLTTCNYLKNPPAKRGASGIKPKKPKNDQGPETQDSTPTAKKQNKNDLCPVVLFIGSINDVKYHYVFGFDGTHYNAKSYLDYIPPNDEVFQKIISLTPTNPSTNPFQYFFNNFIIPKLFKDDGNDSDDDGNDSDDDGSGSDHASDSDDDGNDDDGDDGDDGDEVDKYQMNVIMSIVNSDPKWDCHQLFHHGSVNNIGKRSFTIKNVTQDQISDSLSDHLPPSHKYFVTSSGSKYHCHQYILNHLDQQEAYVDMGYISLETGITSHRQFVWFGIDHMESKKLSLRYCAPTPILPVHQDSQLILLLSLLHNINKMYIINGQRQIRIHSTESPKSVHVSLFLDLSSFKLAPRCDIVQYIQTNIPQLTIDTRSQILPHLQKYNITQEQLEDFLKYPPNTTYITDTFVQYLLYKDQKCRENLPIDPKTEAEIEAENKVWDRWMEQWVNQTQISKYLHPILIRKLYSLLIGEENSDINHMEKKIKEHHNITPQPAEQLPQQIQEQFQQQIQKLYIKHINKAGFIDQFIAFFGEERVGQELQTEITNFDPQTTLDNQYVQYPQQFIINLTAYELTQLLEQQTVVPQGHITIIDQVPEAVINAESILLRKIQPPTDSSDVPESDSDSSDAELDAQLIAAGENPDSD